MDDISKYAELLNPALQAVMEALHHEIIRLPGIVVKERYKLPFYYHRSWICYLHPTKDGAIELAFTRGNELSNDEGILSFRGRKQIAGILCRQLSDIPLESIRITLLEAYELDRTRPYKHPGKRPPAGRAGSTGP